MTTISASPISPSGDLSAISNVHGRSFVVQRRTDDGWTDLGRLDLFADSAFLNNQKLHNLYGHVPSNSVNFSYGKGDEHRSGRLYMTADGSAFVGTLDDGISAVMAVRGHNTSALFATSRKQEGSPQPAASWKTLEIGTDWSDDPTDQRLKAFYKLGGEVITSRTAVTDVESWRTTIEMVADPNPLGDSDSFLIVVDYQGNTFAGTYTDEGGTIWEWTGAVTPSSAQARTATASTLAAFDEATDGPPLHPRMMTPQLRMAATGPSLSVQDLLNVSSVYPVDVNGKTQILDTAQVQTGKYFQSLLINALPDPWLTDFFGSPDPVPAAVDAVRASHAEWYEQKSVMNLGQMLHDAFRTDPTNKAIVAKIDMDKIQDAWKSLSTDTAYQSQASDLYIQGYKDGVPGIQPYLSDNPVNWANQLYDTLMSEDFLNMWTVQVASDQFKNVRQQMYEWWVQLQVLNPADSEKPQAMLQTMYAAVLNAQFNKATWVKDMEPFLAAVIKNILEGNGDPVRNDQILKANYEQVKAELENIVGAYGDSVQFADDLAAAMTLWSLQNPNTRLARVGEGAWATFAANNPRLAQFASTAGKVMGSLAYAAGAGFIIYSLVESGKQKITPYSVVMDINLGILAVGLLVKSVEKLFATSIGDWFRAPAAAAGESRLVGAMRNFGKWFTEAGIDEGSWVAKVFGKSAGDFFAYRIGPALAVFAIVVSAWDLYKDVKAGHVRSEVFDAINLVLSVATLVFLGLEMMSFAWAGPVGLVIAAIGLVVALVQLIWDLVDPQPQPNPVKDFVDGPLTAAGFVAA